MQKDLYAAAKRRLKDNTVLANSIEEVESIGVGGGKFVMAHLKDDPGDGRPRQVVQGERTEHASCG